MKKSNKELVKELDVECGDHGEIHGEVKRCLRGCDGVGRNFVKVLDERDAEIARLKEESGVVNVDGLRVGPAYVRDIREQLLSKSAHIELLRGALERIKNYDAVNSESDFASLEAIFEIADEALSSSQDSVLEEVRRLRRIEEAARKAVDKTRPATECARDWDELLEALAPGRETAQQKRGSR